ncbi:MAG: hypothetical protein Q8R30_05340 [bacterium]|nr:hypothetical protein [bacterium]
MSNPHISLHGYWLDYDESSYNDQKDAFNYLYKLDASQIKTLFDAAKYSGEANFKSDYGYDYKIVYDPSERSYTLVKK